MALESNNDVNESPEKVNDIGIVHNQEIEEIFNRLFQDDYEDGESSKNSDIDKPASDASKTNLENNEARTDGENPSESRSSEAIMRDLFQDDYQEEESLGDNIKRQDETIAKVESGEKELETTQEKGNFGEMKTDQDLRDKGYKRLSEDMVTSLEDPGHQGIDGVYENPEGHPRYLIVDSKFGSSQLSDTSDGKQMSANWIDTRLDEAVGKDKADEIRKEMVINPENVGTYVAHVDDTGNVLYDKVDTNGNTIERNAKINA